MASKLTEIDVIPHRTKSSINSGYNAGASPQIEQGILAVLPFQLTVLSLF
jgi:hypothetical protein